MKNTLINSFRFADGSICSCISSNPDHEEHVPPDDGDVEKEEEIVKQQTRENIRDPNIVLQIRGLAKTYPRP